MHQCPPDVDRPQLSIRQGTRVGTRAVAACRTLLTGLKYINGQAVYCCLRQRYQKEMKIKQAKV